MKSKSSSKASVVKSGAGRSAATKRGAAAKPSAGRAKKVASSRKSAAALRSVPPLIDPPARAGRRPYSPPEISPLSSLGAKPPSAVRRPETRPVLGGVRVDALAAEFGTPLYVLDEDALRRRYREMIGAFRRRYSDVKIGWSVKTNWLSAVAAILRSEGAWGEVVSGFEYGICRDLGIPGSEIIFNGPWKTDDELRRAFAEGAHVNIDGDDELRRVARIARDADAPVSVGMRVNLKLNYPPWDKFGFGLEDGRALETARLIAAEPKLKLERLHLHVGTYVPDSALYGRGAEALTALALKLESELGLEIRHLDLGGGYATRNTLRGAMLSGELTAATLDDYAEAVTAPIRKAAKQFKRPPTLFLEPGRVLIDEAMAMVSTVRAVKRVSGKAKAAIMDVGVHILPTAYWYQHDVRPVFDDGRALETYRLAGPLCMQIDVVRESVVLPSLRAGDLLVVSDVGAYNFSQSMQFIQLRPPVVLLKDGRAELVRTAETPDYVRLPERLPQHLVNAETGSSALARR